jgi:plastocyanin
VYFTLNRDRENARPIFGVVPTSHAEWSEFTYTSMKGENRMRAKILLIFLFLVSTQTACGGASTSVEPILTPPAISVQITKDDCPSIEVQAGMQIAWINRDTVDRILMIERKDEQGAIIDLGGTDLLQPGTTFSINLTTPGQYTYYCSKDRRAFGTITVLP